MQYALLIYGDPEHQPSPDQYEAMGREFQAYTEGLRARGAMLEGNPLTPPSSATTVRIRNGNRLVTDGPFAETKEWLGGYYIIEAATLDNALEAAAMCPGAKYGSVEIRPVADLS